MLLGVGAAGSLGTEVALLPGIGLFVYFGESGASDEGLVELDNILIEGRLPRREKLLKPNRSLQ